MSVTANKSDKSAMLDPPDDAFCLRWNHFQVNMVNVFEQLLVDERFVDVTLACDSQLIRAHKMVLAASSTYFQEIFTQIPCTHPVIILKDVRLNDLRKLLEFMYKGETNVSKEEFESLVLIGEAFQVRGLTQIEFGVEEPTPSTSKDTKSTECQQVKRPTANGKRTSESSIESLVLIDEDLQSQPAKQAKLTNHISCTKSSTDTHEVDLPEQDFLANTAEFEATDYEPITVDGIRIKSERDDSSHSADNTVSFRSYLLLYLKRKNCLHLYLFLMFLWSIYLSLLNIPP